MRRSPSAAGLPRQAGAAGSTVHSGHDGPAPQPALRARDGFSVMRVAGGKIDRLLVLMRGARADAGQRALPYDWFSEEEAGRYNQALGQHPGDAVDDATAHDLHLPAYVRHLAAQCSIFGRQYIVRKLRAGAAEGNPDPAQAAAELDAVRARIDALRQSRTALAAVVQGVAGLRAVESEVASFIFGHGGITLPAWFDRIRYFDVLVLLLLAALLIWPSAWTGAALAACFVLAVVFQMRWYRLLQAWTRQRDTLLEMLRAARALAAARDDLPALLRCDALASPEPIDKLIGRLRAGWLVRVPALTEYLNLVFLHEYARASRDMAAIQGQRQALGRVFEAVARAEAEAALAALADRGPFCWATASAPAQMAVHDLVHPLLAEPAALSVTLKGRGLFISGRNGVGKSTLLRALGLAVLTARAFGYAHAHAASLPSAAVWTSIQVQDSIEQGQSLYMAEMQRAALLCQVAAQGSPAVFIVDELFRGTNYVESVAACAATVRALCRGGVVIVASHNVVLATLLAPWLTAQRLMRAPHAAGPLVLEPGVVIETNGVAMMRDHAFDAAIVERAERIHGWYAGYVTHPDQLPGDLLDQAPAGPGTDGRSNSAPPT